MVEVRDRAEAEKRAGGSLDQTIQAITARFGDRAPDQARLAGAIRSAYLEALLRRGAPAASRRVG
jgi:hypothetical protein